MSSFWNRTIFGALFIVVLVFCLLKGPYYFGALFLFFCIFSINEFANINRDVIKHKLFLIISSILIFSTCFVSAFVLSNNKILSSLIPLFFLPFILEILSKQKDKKIAEPMLQITGLIYVVVPFSLLNFLCISENKYTSDILLPFFILIWANDTFAYLVGRSFGKHKFYESISPKKTWEGTIGGSIATIIFAFFFERFFIILSGQQWMVLAFIVTIFGTIGDLIESLMKRNLGIKDSGFFLPGHGGFLDRFDSLLLSAPFVFVYVNWILS